METVTNRLREWRKERGLTQEEVAKAVNVSRQTIIAIEGGDYLPSVLLALKIARHFKHPVEELFQIK